MPEFTSSRRVSVVLLRTELGITSTSPPRVRSVVERQVTSVTTPVVPPTVTLSPGRTTRPIMRPSPPIMFEMVSCRPSEIATETTPSAVMRPDGSTPNTGFITERSANDQMNARRIFTKMEALGTSEESSTFLVRRTTTRCATSATHTATAMTTALRTSSSIELTICCSIGAP